MTTERITFDDESAWLAARTLDITSTDVAALPGLDVSPYLSPFELFLRKSSGEIPQFEVSERMKWGTRLQDSIARGVAEDEGLKVRRMNAYLRDPDKRIGSSFDFEVVDHPKGPGIMEIKLVDRLVFDRNWIEGSDGYLEAPPHIELQLQHQLLISGRPWGMIVALVGGNTIKPAYRDRNEAVGNVILTKVAEFWMAVEKKVAPAIDYVRDAKAISMLYSKSDPGKVIDLTGDPVLNGLTTAYKDVREGIKVFEDRKAELKARMLERIGTAEKVIGGDWSISAKAIADNPGKIITAEMLGTMIGARRGYRDFRVFLKKEK